MASQQDEINSNLCLFNYIYNQIPDNWNSHNDFIEYLIDIFSQYLSRLPSFQEPIKTELETYNQLPKKICYGLLAVVKYYLDGKHYEAYLHMRQVFNDVKSILIKRSSIPSQLPLQYAFRGRNISNTEKPVTREDLFHIPFENRHLVCEHRFSQHGVPAIYLGSSIIDCFTELNLHSIEDFWVSMFIFNNHNVIENSSPCVKLIDLTVTSLLHWFNLTWSKINQNPEGYNNAIQSIMGDILLWPLIRTCTIACKYPNAPFQQEYIIPKLLFQICTDTTDFIGIKYQSTHTNLVCSDSRSSIMHNIALPARKITSYGHCPVLSTQLLMTDPINIRTINPYLEIQSKNKITQSGLPILTDRDLLFSDAKLLRQFDQMTMHFESMLSNFEQEITQKRICPLGGWDELND